MHVLGRGEALTARDSHLVATGNVFAMIHQFSGLHGMVRRWRPARARRATIASSGPARGARDDGGDHPLSMGALEPRGQLCMAHLRSWYAS